MPSTAKDFYHDLAAYPKPGKAKKRVNTALADEKLRMLAYKAKHRACEECGSTWMVTTHHKKPKRMGGTRNKAIMSEDNWICLCVKCHSTKHGIKVVNA